MKSKCGAALLLMLVLVMACAGALAAEYTVTFNENNIIPGSSGTTFTVTNMPSQMTVTEGGKVNEPTAPTADGYVFGGWYTDENCASAYDFETQVQQNFTLYAKWMLAVTFHDNAPRVTDPGTGNSTPITVAGMPNPATVPIGATVVQPKNPTATGYVFGGWYTDENCTSAYDFNTLVEKSFTLYAKWMLEVTFDVNAPTVTDPVSGTSTTITVSGKPNPATVPIGDTVVQPENPTAEGYTFEGWYTKAECTNAYNFTTPVRSCFTLYAKWERKTYTVTFDLQGGNFPVADPPVPTTVTVNHDDNVTEPAAPTKDRYSFGGWYREPTCATKFKFSDEQNPDTVTSNITLYAKWSIKQYQVTFDKNGHGVQPPAQTVNHGDKAKNPGDLVEQGYRFEYWYDAAGSADAEYNFNTPVTGNIALKAKWTKQHTVKFNLNGHGAVIKPVTVDDGSTLSAPTAPSVEGYDFVEWDWYGEPASTVLEKFKFKGEEDADTVTRDIELVAKWTANVKVTFRWQKAITHEGDDPTGSATVKLLGNGAGVSGANELTVQPDGTGAWTELAADVKYSVMAMNVPTNYTAVCTRTGENTFLVTYVENEKLTVSTITNKHEVDKIDMVISKFWDDNNNKHRPGSIQVQVKKVVESGTTNVGSPIMLNDSNQWTAHVTDLYMRENGKTIQYIIEEVGDVKGYKATCEIVVDAQGNYTVRVTNVLTGKLDLEGWKKWDDDNDRDGIRPQSVQLKIYENSISPPTTLVKNVIVDASTANPNDANMWKWTVEDLPVYDKFGSPITYIVVEDPVPAGYTASDPQYITVGTTTTP